MGASRQYIYLLVKPHTTDHPINMILTTGHYLYEVRHFAVENNHTPEDVEVWRMRAGETVKVKLGDWMDK